MGRLGGRSRIAGSVRSGRDGKSRDTNVMLVGTGSMSGGDVTGGIVDSWLLNAAPHLS